MLPEDQWFERKSSRIPARELADSSFSRLAVANAAIRSAIRPACPVGERIGVAKMLSGMGYASHYRITAQSCG